MIRAMVALTLAAAVGLQTHLLHRHLTRVELPRTAETVWLPPAPVLKVLSFGYDRLVADLLWLQVIQYYGGKLLAKDTSMPNLWPFFDAVTTLDPDFDEAYFFGSYLLADDLDRPDLALNLLDRGRRHRLAAAGSDGAATPERLAGTEAWRYPYQMAFVHYFYRQDKAEASRFFRMAADLPGAPPICLRLAAALSEQTGERETARRMWALVYQSATDSYTRTRAERNLLRLKIEEDVETLRRTVVAFHGQNQRWPESLAELVELEWLPAVPNDPNGRAYGYDPQSGTVTGPEAPAD
jgi:hypothetical protein